ncbi:MAG: FAD-dependent monooxygenase [Gemmataceae bacterium]
MTLAATLTPEMAAGRRWPVVVVGAGPAGSTAAAELARRGVAVLLVDQATFPRAKVCGCCLNRRALTALAAAGLDDVPDRLGAVPLATTQIGCGGRTARLRLPSGRAVSREAFDAALIEAAVARGADFLPATRATLLDGDPTAERRLLLRGPAGEVETAAAVVLAADGLAGTLRARQGPPPRPVAGSRIGAGTTVDRHPFYEPGVIYLACGDGGYVGLVVVEDGRLDVAAAFAAEAVRAVGGAGLLAARLLDRAGWPTPAGLAATTWRGTPALTRRADHVAGARLFALGDATGYVEPFTGEGMAWAISSAVALAPLAAAGAVSWQARLADAWRQRHRAIVTRRQRTCHAAAALLRHPRLAAVLIGLLGWLPALSVPVVRHLNRPFFAPLPEVR